MYEAGLVLQLQHLLHTIETKAGRTALVSIHIVIENLTYDWQPE